VHGSVYFELRLRIEFLLKTDSGYPKDTGVIFILALGIPSAITPIGQLHQSPPWPIPGDLGRGPSHQSTCWNIKTRMHRPKCVVSVIRGVALTVVVSRLFIESSSGMYGICYLRVFDYVSVSQCATGPARESEVYPWIHVCFPTGVLHSNGFSGLKGVCIIFLDRVCIETTKRGVH